MADEQQLRLRLILRGYELRLLRCTSSDISPPSDDTNTNNIHSMINDLLNLIETGHYLQALSSDAAKLLTHLPALPDSCSPEHFYSELLDHVGHFITNSDDDDEAACRAILVLCVAIAAFFLFTQNNITGPMDESRSSPLTFKVLEDGEFAEWENWARNHLMDSGCHLLGKFSNLQFLVFAKILVTRIKDLKSEGSVSETYGIRSISWWLARVLFVQQRILDELSSSLFDLLHVYVSESLHLFGTSEKVTSYWGANLQDGEASCIVSMVHLEAGLMEQIYGRVDSCRMHFESAEASAGIQLSVSGALGYRTVHQAEPKVQRVLLVNRTSSNSGANITCSSVTPGIQNHDSTIIQGTSVSQQQESSEILITPKMLEDEIGAESNQNLNNSPGGATPLTAMQQAVILAQCLLIEKSSRHDELQRWDMAPFIETIDSQSPSLFIIQFFCNYLRIRWECTRSRTKERSLGMMEKLVEVINNPLPGVAERISFSYATYVPAIPILRKEYGELLVSCGLMGEALKVFEGLELWDNLIYCNRILGKKAAAVELIKTRLSEMPNDPSLWCSLGDVTNNDSCFEKALEVSNNKSARAKRSLARSAYNRGDYETSKILWESAMTLNSLYPDGWFALGAAALKARDVDKALHGFTLAVKLDPDNGEAWNNIACLHMVKKRSNAAFIAFKEALKFKRDSWQMWENYSHVAMDVGNVRQGLEAIQMVLQITKCKQVDVGLLERVMLEMEGRVSSGNSLCNSVKSDDSSTNGTIYSGSHDVSGQAPETQVQRSRETEQLVELLGKILQQIIKSDSRADVWGLYARWHKIKGDLTMCSEALLKQVRSYQGSDLWKDRDRFIKFANASLELCKVYMEISSSTGSKRELFAAEMHLKNIAKQAENFSDTEEFRDLQACLDEVRMKLLSNNPAT
ncbi:Protein prenylyltransferase superfamily protein [Euphorbia peplus]|nr:Protein prenylyltransferase superfamily protein [Euphorbia peplus]